jgi:ElaB/YqjD/DUF883 family membrane-anchored ribosome-binding protein
MKTMDRITAYGSGAYGSGAYGSGTAAPDAASNLARKVDAATMAAHQLTDQIADKATVQVDRLSGVVHRAVNSVADAATTTAEFAATAPDRAQQAGARLTEAACTSIRARPIGAVVGAAMVGYLLGRLARL